MVVIVFLLSREKLLPLYKISTTMAKLNTADIGFEDQIWKAADKMRGNIDGEIENWK